MTPGLRFTFPLFKEMVLDITYHPISPHQYVSATKSVKELSREYYIGRLPNWEQYIAYFRATFGLPNSLNIPLVVKQDFVSFCNPQFLTPVYVDEFIAPRVVRGLVSSTLVSVDACYKLITSKLTLPQLWK